MLNIPDLPKLIPLFSTGPEAGSPLIIREEAGVSSRESAQGLFIRLFARPNKGYFKNLYRCVSTETIIWSMIALRK